jgi:GNAT superfamily N-acetyltransferase
VTEFWGRIFPTASAALHDHLDEGYWELDLLAVDPARQGQGVGSMLVCHLNQRADLAGAQVGLITVNPRNPPFHERHGYSVVADATDDRSGVHWWACDGCPRPDLAAQPTGRRPNSLPDAQLTWPAAHERSG